MVRSFEKDRSREETKPNWIVDEETGAVTLTESYLRTLAAGDHTLTVVLSGAETTTNFTVPAADDPSAAPPQPGDDSPVGLWLILMSVSAAGAICLFLFGRKQSV